MTARIIDIPTKDRFHLSEAFLNEFEDKEPPFGPLGELVYRRTYSRRLGEGDSARQEKWWETIRRVVEGTYTVQAWHCKKLGLPWNPWKAQKSAQEMYRLMFDMKFLPPGRGLWMMGTDYIEEKGGLALLNCAFIGTENLAQDFADPFATLMDFSMLGVGVGSNVKGAGSVKIKEPKVDAEEIHYVEDSREGWCDLVRRILNSYVGKDTFPETIDYTQVRPEGDPIRGFGGTAAGSAPLRTLVEELKNLLDQRIDDWITGSNIVDICNLIGKCVVAGNIRRSAELLLGESSDEEFLALKDPTINADKLESHRWASNNSVYVHEGQNYQRLAEQTAQNGEPGFFWIENARAFGRMKDPANYEDNDVVGTNPCSEQPLVSYEACCLAETFPSRHDSLESYLNTLKFAYLYAKTVTLIPTHNEKTNAIQLRNRRIGLSQSGVTENFRKIGRRAHFTWCDESYEFLRALDRKYSNWLCVPRSKKITTQKPSGTVSLLPGVTPGIHYPHSEYYYRTIRISKTSKLLQPLIDANYRVEEDVCDSSSMVAYFPIHEQNFLKGKEQVSMWEQLENAAQMQYYWSDNSISITVTFSKAEADNITAALELYETRLKSVSFLPLQDHKYEQAPYIEITKEEYEQYVKKLKKIKFDEDSHEIEDKFCDGDSCSLN